MRRVACMLLLVALGGCSGSDSPTAPEAPALRVDFSAPPDAGAGLATVCYTLGGAQDSVLTGILHPPFRLALSDTALAGAAGRTLRAYGYDADGQLRWLRYRELAEDEDDMDVRLTPLDVESGFPMPPPYPNHALTTGYRPFASLDTLRDSQDIPLHHVWGYDEPVYSRHWINKIILSNFENFQLSGEESYRQRALFLTDWLLERAQHTPLGGLAFPEPFDYPGHVLLLAPWNGAFTHGLTISVLVRAHLLSGDPAYLDAARQAMQAAMLPTGLPGGSVMVAPGDRLWLEEYPSFPPQHTLNGAIFGIWSILDWWFNTGDPAAERMYRAFVRTLELDLPYYDSGTWTWYDRWGTVATPGYHQLHISQMAHLDAQTGLPVFSHFHDLWESYLGPPASELGPSPTWTSTPSGARLP